MQKIKHPLRVSISLRTKITERTLKICLFGIAFKTVPPKMSSYLCGYFFTKRHSAPASLGKHVTHLCPSVFPSFYTLWLEIPCHEKKQVHFSPSAVCLPVAIFHLCAHFAGKPPSVIKNCLVSSMYIYLVGIVHGLRVLL